MNICVKASGMINPVGVGTEQVLAAVGAGLSLYKESSIVDCLGTPYTLAQVPEACLPELDPAIMLASMKGRYKRMLKLALGGLDAFLADLPTEVLPPLLLALPERYGGQPFPALEPLLKDLFSHRCVFDLAQSKVYPEGRAATILALSDAYERLSSGQCDQVIVGGVDTSVDVMLLSQWHKENRLLTSMTMQGFVPGEGAAFVLLSLEKTPGAAHISGMGSGQEPGHYYSEETCLGNGLTAALTAATQALTVPASTVCCGLNGENVAIKEWGIAASKVTALHGEFELLHPAECYGDLGAATLVTLLGLCVQGLKKKSIKGPAVLWASSDNPLRGALTLSIDESPS